jgi:hypothetical protein
MIWEKSLKKPSREREREVFLRDSGKLSPGWSSSSSSSNDNNVVFLGQTPNLEEIRRQIELDTRQKSLFVLQIEWTFIREGDNKLRVINS